MRYLIYIANASDGVKSFDCHGVETLISLDLSESDLSGCVKAGEGGEDKIGVYVPFPKKAVMVQQTAEEQRNRNTRFTQREVVFDEEDVCGGVRALGGGRPLDYLRVVSLRDIVANVIVVCVERGGGEVITMGKTERRSQTTMLLIPLFFKGHDRNSILSASKY